MSFTHEEKLGWG